MSNPSTVFELLCTGKNDAVSISAPHRPGLAYRELRQQVESTIAVLNKTGIGRNDRIAIVLPNGPEMASAFICVAAGATAAPLNPAYQLAEFDFYMRDLNTRALIVEQGSNSAAIEVAKTLQIPVLELISDTMQPAGNFKISTRFAGSAPKAAANGGKAEPEDIALVLHTSGTTSRPKIVPLTQRNICTSAANIRKTLQLTEKDRCLNVMPLFHIHGLMAAVLSSLSAGGNVFCSPGFNAMQFFEWLDESEATWYSAVPTMHQMILGRAKRNQKSIEKSRLRFIRSSSSSLPTQVFKELEDTFSVPVIEAYGMTEASHQMTSNPLPPQKQKPGSVGIPTGLEVAIMEETGILLPTGSTGEIVIRGENVTSGYENNPKANAENFTNGWFRTGDQGAFDEDGYLTIKGRLKEIINRGGEKISPLEVDEALMEHPAVLQAVTFGMPHAMLGEEVAAAVVLRPGMNASAQDLKDFLKSRLVNFKIPREILILEEIPKGPTGKLQRIGLAEKLGLS